MFNRLLKVQNPVFCRIKPIKTFPLQPTRYLIPIITLFNEFEHQKIAKMGTATRILVAYSFFCIAHAHMVLEPRTAEAGSRTDLTFRIAHDCGDDTIGTSNFTIELRQDPPMLGVTVHQVPM